MNGNGILEAKSVDKAAFDAFTPFQVFGGMLSRSLGADATQALVASLVTEAVQNALAAHAKPVPRPESPVNMLADIGAGLAGWLLMDWLMQRK